MAAPKYIVYHSAGDGCKSLYMGDDRSAADDVYKAAAAALREDEAKEPGSRGGEEIGFFLKPQPDKKVRPLPVASKPEPVEEKPVEEKEPEKLDPETVPEKQEPKSDKPKGKKPAVDEPPGNFKPVE